MAAIRSTSTFVNTWPTTATSTTFAAPTGIQDDDILVIFLTIGDGYPASSIDTPSGFTQATGFPVTDNASDYYLVHACFYKVASSESGNYTVTHTSGVNGGIMYCISGADTTTPLSPNPVVTTGTTSEGASLAATGLTTGNDNDAVLAYWATWDDAGPASPPSGFTEYLDNSIHYSAAEIQASAGATGTVTLSSANSNHLIWVGMIVAIQDSGGSVVGDLVQSDRNSGGTATLTLPGAPTSGNLLIYGTVSGNSGVTLSTPPPGFTPLTSQTSADFSSWWGYKISDGTETSRNHAWSGGNGYSFYAEYYWQEGTPRVQTNEDTSNITADGTGPQSSGSVTPNDLTTNLCLAFITSRYQPSTDGSGAFSNSYTADISFAATPTLAGTALASLAGAAGSTSSSYSWSDSGMDTYGAIAAFSPPGESSLLLLTNNSAGF